MKIFMQKFGRILVSRPAGREAILAFQPTLASVSDTEDIELDFEGVFSLAPSWADEFLRPLMERFGDRVKILPTDNTAVRETLAFLKRMKS